jgi:hypothetical protein
MTLCDWFQPEIIRDKREVIAMLIKEKMERESQGGDVQELPDISFYNDVEIIEDSEEVNGNVEDPNGNFDDQNGNGNGNGNENCNGNANDNNNEEVFNNNNDFNAIDNNIQQPPPPQAIPSLPEVPIPSAVLEVPRILTAPDSSIEVASSDEQVSSTSNDGHIPLSPQQTEQMSPDLFESEEQEEKKNIDDSEVETVILDSE